MKRRLFKLALFLLLGAIVNVAVAWGCAFWIKQGGALSNNYMTGLSERGIDHEGWSTRKYETNGSLRVISSWAPKNQNVLRIRTGMVDTPIPPAESFIPQWADFLRPYYIDQPELGMYKFVADARGWPLLSMWGGHKRIEPPRFLGGGAKRHPYVFAEPIPIRAILLSFDEKPYGRGEHTSRFLPLAPIWHGFAINTVFYAAILWLLTLGPFTARRMIRRKRGLCIKCGYDLRHVEHEVCPECGCELIARVKS